MDGLSEERGSRSSPDSCSSPPVWTQELRGNICVKCDVLQGNQRPPRFFIEPTWFLRTTGGMASCSLPQGYSPRL